MSARVVVIGAGMGGLTAAIRLAQRGVAVEIIEARKNIGGLASALNVGGATFDTGPYILLDRPGLSWAFRQLSLDLDALVPLRRIENIYQVETPSGNTIAFYSSATQTAEGFEKKWPGSAQRYLRFVEKMRQIHTYLQPLLYISRPSVWSLVASGGWRHVLFLQRSLECVLRATGLPEPIIQSIAIWTHVAGQTLDVAPSPLAFVPALMHEPGAFYPRYGIGSVIEALATAAQAAGVVIRTNAQVQTINTTAGKVTGVTIADGSFIPATTVLSNAHGVGSYCSLVQDLPPQMRTRLDRLPLQSPGICAYLSVKIKSKTAPQPYLRFRLLGAEALCRLLVMPSVLVPENICDGWATARLIAPMRHNEAQQLGADSQRVFAEKLLNEPWWRDQVDDARVLHIRTPSEWGAQHHLYRDSMNPVMTAQFMRAGRLAHRSPFIKGLHLAGSSTHPGQWISFSAISGILSADQV
jgi:phytoene dehydrogenase-like protein